MREIFLIEKSVVVENGRTVLRERRCHGLMEAGGFRLLSYCGKRVPIRTPETAGTSNNFLNPKKREAA